MDSKRLEEIKARVEAATAGPWGTDGDSVYPRLQGGWICQLFYKDEARMPNSKNNAAFIAHSRQDVQDLLAEVERLQTTVREERANIDHLTRALEQADNLNTELVNAILPLLEVIYEDATGGAEDDGWFDRLFQAAHNVQAAVGKSEAAK